MGVDPDRPARELLRGRVRREFPSEYLDLSLNEIKQRIRHSAGPEKRKLQKAKKLLEQQRRLGDKSLGE